MKKCHFFTRQSAFFSSGNSETGPNKRSKCPEMFLCKFILYLKANLGVLLTIHMNFIFLDLTLKFFKR